MHTVSLLEKHCKTSKDGVIALSNGFVETAVKVHNCPIKVTCDDYPGEESIYSVDDLLKPKFTSGPYENKFGPGDDTYMLYMYAWKGVKPEPAAQVVEENKTVVITEVSGESILQKTDKGYVIRTPIVTTSYEETPVTLLQYVGFMLTQLREKRGLKQSQLAALTNGKVSAPTVSRIESGDANTSLVFIEALADTLGVHITDLFPPKD